MQCARSHTWVLTPAGWLLCKQMTPTELRDKHKGLLLKDLRIQLRARGLNPAGGREALLDRLVDAMVASQDLCATRLFLTACLQLNACCTTPHASCSHSTCQSLLVLDTLPCQSSKAAPSRAGPCLLP